MIAPLKDMEVEQVGGAEGESYLDGTYPIGIWDLLKWPWRTPNPIVIDPIDTLSS